MLTEKVCSAYAYEASFSSKNSVYAYEASFSSKSSKEAKYMKWKARIFTIIALSGMLALGMSFLPKMAAYTQSGSAEFGSGSRAVQLTEHNLVDLLIQVPLQLRIRKVELSHSVLWIDLGLPKNVEEASVYRDLYMIVQSTINKTSNVNQVLVRIMDYSNMTGGSSALMVLAMEADREHAQNLDAHLQEVSSVLLEQQVKARFHLTYTPRWQERYPL
jgi:hypothetical protein